MKMKLKSNNMRGIIKWVLICTYIITPFFQFASSGKNYHFCQITICVALVSLFILKINVMRQNNFQIRLTLPLALAMSFFIPLLFDFFDPPSGINKVLGFVLLIFSFSMAILVFGTAWAVKEEESNA
jgi:hypothetical protein